MAVRCEMLRKSMDMLPG